MFEICDAPIYSYLTKSHLHTLPLFFRNSSPTQDYIPPHATRTCKIVLTHQSEIPDLSDPKKNKDKFLVQSVVVGKEVDELSKMVRSQEREAQQHNMPNAKVNCTC